MTEWMKPENTAKFDALVDSEMRNQASKMTPM